MTGLAALHSPRRVALWIIAIAFAVLTTGQSGRAADAPAMILPGKHDVNATGAFTYTVPIAVPPGTAGMVPALSLDYSSQGGDGFEGLGWSLSGLPAITRCARTLSQDGVHGNVNFDSNDRFCMQGQRLVALSSTTMTCPSGVPVTEYRLEIDGYTRVISCGNTGSGSNPAAGPTFFKAWTKTGQIMEFGTTPDSQGQLVQAPNATTGVAGTVRTWAVNKISDTAGNYLTVTYDNGTPDTANGQLYPTEIDYTGHDGNGVQTAPYNSVRFKYSPAGYRKDVVPMYQTGAVTRMTVLLTNVTTYLGTQSGGTLVSNYSLAYELAANGAEHDELKMVTVFDGNGNALPATQFNWQGSRDKLTMTKQTLSFAQGSYEDNRGYIFPGDYNGDGLMDVAAGNNIAPGGCNVFFGQPGTAQAPLNFTVSDMTAEKYIGGQWVLGPACFTGVATKPRYLPRFMDFDGNGLSDVLARDAGPNDTIAALRNDGNHHLVHTDAPGLFDDSFTGDFNGDGLTDVLGRVQSDSWFNIFTSAGNGHFNATSYFYDDDATIYLGDVDGDGCMDVIQQRRHQEIDFAPLCNPRLPSIEIRDWGPGDGGNQFVVGDFNGDGKADYLGMAFGLPFDIELLLSSGTNFQRSTDLNVPQSFFAYTIETGDFNGDGKTDLLLIADDQDFHADTWTKEQVWLSTGTNFVQATDPSGNPILLDSGNATDKPVNHIANIRGVMADYNNDGATDIWIQKPSGDAQYTFAYVPELIKQVTNGIGVMTTVTYDRLNENGALYAKCPGGTCNDVFPVSGIDAAFYVVSRLDTSNGIGGNYSSTYAYGGAKVDSWGRGFLGFQTVSVTDLQTHIVQATNYRTDFPFIGLIASQTKTCPQPYCSTTQAVQLNATTNTFQANADCSSGSPTGPVYNVYLCQTVAASTDLDGTAMPATETDYASYDNYGNAGSVTVSTTPPGGGAADAVKQTTNNFNNFIDATHWCLSRLMSASVKSTWAGVGKYRRTNFDYDIHNGTASTCLLTRETVEPAQINTNLWQETDYGYDVFGNKTTVTALGCADAASPCTPAAPRVTQTGYDTRGQFPITVTNAATQTEQWTFDPGFGEALTQTGPNNLKTTTSYDGFGRKTKVLNPDGTYAVTSYNYCTDAGTTCPTAGAFLMTTSAFANNDVQMGPTSMVYYDMLSRSVASDVQGFDGSWIRVDTLYDANGREAAVDRPYFRGAGTIVPCANGSTACTTFAYDNIGRVLSVTAPDHSVTQTQYDGLTQTVINALGEITTTVKNDLGKTASVTDALALGHPDPNFLHTTRYTYDPFGDSLSVTDPAGNVSTNVYDTRGRKLKSSDPDLGNWTYAYDSFGEIIQQTDPNESHNGTGPTTMAYDVLGRTTDRVEPDMTAHWDYDGATHGIGKIQDAICTGAACAGGASYTRTYTYDLKSRQIRLTTAIGSQSYYTTTAYDPNTAKVSQVRAFSSFSVVYAYNTYGYLFEIDDLNNRSVAYWRANTRDAELHVVSQTAANGVTTTQNYDPLTGRVLAIHGGTNDSVANLAYQWDAIGNLTQRSDLLAVTGGQTENFCYDRLNRLTNASLTGNCNAPLAKFQYDALGNITSKYDVGSYTYSQQHPHAVASINTNSNSGFGQGCTVAGGCTVNGVQNPTFTYDRDGNMLTGAGRTVTYTASSMTATVVQGTTTVALGYDAEHTRIQQVTTVAGAATTTTYLNDPASSVMTERVTGAGGGATWKTYIMAEGHIAAVRSSQGSTVALRYFVLDHLSSVSVVTDETGTVAANGRLFYDAWGKMRNADGTPDPSCALPAQSRNAAQTTRGFTSQEQIPEVCLANFNARIYDPQIGRFMSADTEVEQQFDPQDLNRYTYVADNPLSLTDPTGHGFLGELLSALITVAIAIYAPELIGPWADAGAVLSAAAGGDLGAIGFVALEGAVAGGISSAISGGDILSGILFGGISGALMAGVGGGFGLALGDTLGNATVGNFIGLGFVGGCTSSMQGGNFGSGFLSAGVGSLGGSLGGGTFDAGRMLISAVLGGSASVLGGGKFASGAVSAAFAYAATASRQETETIAGGADPNATPGTGTSNSSYVKAGKIILATDEYGKDGVFLDLDKRGLIVLAHGDPHYLYESGEGTGPYDVDKVARIIQESGLFHGQDILLVACNAGVSANGRTSFAQLLANKLGVTVYGATDWVFLTSDGSSSSHYYVAPSADSRMKWWNTSPSQIRAGDPHTWLTPFKAN